MITSRAELLLCRKYGELVKSILVQETERFPILKLSAIGLIAAKLQRMIALKRVDVTRTLLFLLSHEILKIGLNISP